MHRLLFCLLAITLMASPMAEARKKQTSRKKANTERTIDKVRQEKESNDREIRRANQNITQNTRKTRQQLDSLESIRRRNTDVRAQIDELSARIDSADRNISVMSDSIDALERRAERLRRAYRASMRKIQGDRMASSKIAFIFSAESFQQAVQRIRYLRQFGEWQQRRATEIKNISADLTAHRYELEKEQATQRARVSRLSEARVTLERQEQEAGRLVTELQRHGDQLRDLLRAKEQRARELDRELDRLIAAEQARIEKERQEQLRREREARHREEQRRQKEQRQRQEQQKRNPADRSQSPAPAPALRPSSDDADRKLTGSFTDNKGRLLYPVTGATRVVRRFGTQKHPDMPHVTTENNGIDIETQSGAKARAVFGGRVASILQVQGYNYIVMVRHGDYLTVYSGLDRPSVKAGDEVKAGQTLATVMTDPEREGRGLLHFEIRRGAQKCNPSEWIR